MKNIFAWIAWPGGTLGDISCYDSFGVGHYTLLKTPSAPTGSGTGWQEFAAVTITEYQPEKKRVRVSLICTDCKRWVPVSKVYLDAGNLISLYPAHLSPEFIASLAELVRTNPDEK